jgi:hypothetical protein
VTGLISTAIGGKPTWLRLVTSHDREFHSSSCDRLLAVGFHRSRSIRQTRSMPNSAGAEECPPEHSQHAFAQIKLLSCSGAIVGTVKHSVLSTTPTAEKPALSDEERAERRRLLTERMFRPDGLDRDTLEHIEHLTGNES